MRKTEVRHTKGFHPSYPGRKSFAENLNEIGVVAPTGFEIRTRVWSRPRFRQTFQPFLGPGDTKNYDMTQTRTIAFLKAFTRRDQDSAPIRFGRALQFDRDDAPPERLAKIERDSFVMAWPSRRLCRSGPPSLRPTMTLCRVPEFLGIALMLGLLGTILLFVAKVSR